MPRQMFAKDFHEVAIHTPPADHQHTVYRRKQLSKRVQVSVRTFKLLFGLNRYRDRWEQKLAVLIAPGRALLVAYVPEMFRDCESGTVANQELLDGFVAGIPV